MKTKIHSQSGIFNPRILAVFALGSVGVLLAMLSFAADPPRGMKTPSASSAGASVFVDNHAVPLKGNAAAPASSMPLAPTRPAWSIVSSPNTTHSNHLLGVTCTSASDCWAVGQYFIPGYIGQTLIEHWNGTAWSIVSSPNTGAAQENYLFGITCASASDCWAVGDFIEHWNGTSWSIVTSPNTGTLDAVTCTSASDCWAVGGYRNGLYNQTLIEHWNGTAWSIVTSPNTSTTQSNGLGGVTCTSASDCWAVGDYYNFSIIKNQPHQTLIEHWNGTAWSIVSSPNSSTQFNSLSGVACTSASDCWAVGGTALIEHWNGTAWSIVTSPGATQDSELNDVTCASASDCWAVGSSFTDEAWQTLTEHWNGTAWSIVNSPNNATIENYLFGVTCASASDCWAVGYYFDYGDSAYHTLIERYTPTPTLTNTSTRLKVLTGDNVLIGGLIIAGSDSMTVLFRALGPTLSTFNVPGVLADPTLELHTTDNMGHDVVVATNDNWKESQQAAITATGKAPSFDSESAILRTLAPGSYTLIVRGKNNGTGVALVEAYDVSTGANSELLNISSRGFVDTNANVMIDGFIVGSPSNFLVRALGPTLGAPPINIPGAMTDPTLELHDANGAMIATNDNWKVDDQTHQSQQAAISATGKAPPFDSESVILRTLESGNYTAILRGKNNTTGIALLEVYNLP